TERRPSIAADPKYLQFADDFVRRQGKADYTRWPKLDPRHFIQPIAPGLSCEKRRRECLNHVSFQQGRTHPGRILRLLRRQQVVPQPPLARHVSCSRRWLGPPNVVVSVSRESQSSVAAFDRQMKITEHKTLAWRTRCWNFDRIVNAAIAICPPTQQTP